jgi:preprotein translocase subunit SecA
MRLFGSDRIAGLMDKLGLKEGEVIQHPMISKSIERAQKKVEENHFGVRKRLLEYDDVMNAQREVIYTRRKHALHGDRLGVDIANIMSDVCDNIVNENHGLVDFEEFKLDLIRFLSVDSPVSQTEYNKNSAEEIIDRLYPEVLETYKRKCEIIARQALPVIKDVYARQSHQYTNIVVPVTDGQKVYQIITNLEKAANSDGDELVKSYQKSIVLANIDEAWKEHLREMDDLKQSVQNASYEQKDPLLIYKLESFNLFKAMLDKVNKEIISIFMKGHIPIRNADEVKEAQAPRKHDMSKYDTSRPDVQSSSTAPTERGQIDQKVQPVRVEKKVGRNDPCPCGSGKKYKSCHGKDE